jgi:hypothetical protein
MPVSIATLERGDKLIARARFRAVQLGFPNLTECLRTRLRLGDDEPDEPATRQRNTRRVINNIRNGLGQTTNLIETSEALDIPREEAMVFWFADEDAWKARYNPTMSGHPPATSAA